MALTRKQLEQVCLISDVNGKKCRYLSTLKSDSTIYVCAKKSARKDDIDQEIDLSIKEMQADGRDPWGEGLPMGDNCPGFRVLAHKSQGLV